MKSADVQSKAKKSRSDGQMSSLAGELFVAAELLKRGIQTSVTFGNAKAIDLFAYNSETRKNFTVQVKTVRIRNAFPISHAKIHADHIYVFVILNKPGVPVRYFIVPGAVLASEPARFSKWFKDYKFPGIPPALLEPFEDNWQLFAE